MMKVVLKFYIIYNLSKLLKPSDRFSDKYTNKPVFIIGSQRSGTGFLMSVINQSEKVCNWSEANYAWEPHYYNFLTSETKPHIPGFNGVGVHAHEISRKAKSKTRQRVRRLFGLYSFASGGKRILHKNPFNSVRIEELIDFFPSVKIIHMQRNPKAVVYSSLQKSYSGNESREDFIKQAVYRRHICNQNYKRANKKHSERIKKVQYADLESDDPEAVLSSVFDFIDLPLNEGVQQQLSRFNNKNYKYKKNLSAAEQELIESEVQKLKTCDHYPFS